jgi:predicted nuclease of predicted toxin-antitoxin system
VTFDADFYDISSSKGHPPKIIWLRTGNTTTTFLASLLASKAMIIKSFIVDEAYRKIACLEIN